MGSPLKELVKARESITRETLEALQKAWTETYLALMLIMSKEENKALEHMKFKLAEANEAAVDFFDAEIEKRSIHV
jgi:hypothetical protein